MKTQPTLIAFIVSLAAGTALAKDTASFSAQLEAGALNDSQLFIDELQQSESTGDSAMLYKAAAKLDITPTSKFKLSLGSGYSDKSYQEQQAFDLSLLQANIDASYHFDWLTIGASHHYIDAKLAGDDFLNMNQSSLYLSRLFANRYFVRAYTTQQQKSFATGLEQDGSSDETTPIFEDNSEPSNARSERDADNQNYGIDLFVFFNNAKTFINLGVVQEDEGARSDYLDYQGQSLHTKLGHTFYGLGKKQQLQLGWQWQQRDYATPAPEQEFAREDDRTSADISYQFHFSDTWSMQAKYEVFDYQSNMESAVYDGNKSTFLVKLDF